LLSYFVFPASRRRTKIVITGSLIRVARGLKIAPYRADLQRGVRHAGTISILLLLGVLRAISGMDARDSGCVFSIVPRSMIRARRSENLLFEIDSFALTVDARIG